jgi:DNA-binding response OmpR family regulator
MKERTRVVGGGAHVDLLLTDVVMPGGLNGRQLADKAVGQKPALRVSLHDRIYPQRDRPSGRLDAGINMISKSFSFEELAARVRERLDAPD